MHGTVDDSSARRARGARSRSMLRPVLGRSVNSWVGAVLDAAVNPDLGRLGRRERTRGRAWNEPVCWRSPQSRPRSRRDPTRHRVEAGTEGCRRRHAVVAARLGRARLSVFCDSSALVKLYADEPGADAVRRLSQSRRLVPSHESRCRLRSGESTASVSSPSEDAAVLVDAVRMGLVQWPRA